MFHTIQNESIMAHCQPYHVFSCLLYVYISPSTESVAPIHQTVVDIIYRQCVRARQYFNETFIIYIVCKSVVFTSGCFWIFATKLWEAARTYEWWFRWRQSWRHSTPSNFLHSRVVGMQKLWAWALAPTSHRVKLSLPNIFVSGDGRIYKNVLTLP